MAARQVLTLKIEVRVLAGEPLVVTVKKRRCEVLGCAVGSGGRGSQRVAARVRPSRVA